MSRKKLLTADNNPVIITIIVIITLLKFMYIKRELESKILKYLNKPEIIAIIGPRQSGKTTLLKEIFKSLKNAVYLDFEDRNILDAFNDDVKLFYDIYAKNAKYIFIDEFQYATKGGKGLKYLYDTHKVKIIISGSSSFDLTHQAVKYLVGRVFIFYLFPFNFKEYLNCRNSALCDNVYLGLKKKIDKHLFINKAPAFDLSQTVIKEIEKYYEEYSIFGGYPRVALAKDKDERITILKNIYNTYFLREIRDILQLSTDKELQKLIKALSLQTGSMVAYNELCQTASLSYTNLLKHLDILEKTFIVKRVLPFYKNKRTEIAKSPKIYFFDNGFRNIAIHNFQMLNERIDKGALNENFVASQLLIKEHEINYWRTQSKAEVDFILEKDGKRIAIEVKSMLNSNKAGRGLLSFIEKYSPQKTIVASQNYFSFDKKRNILFLPLFLI